MTKNTDDLYREAHHDGYSPCDCCVERGVLVEADTPASVDGYGRNLCSNCADKVRRGENTTTQQPEDRTMTTKNNDTPKPGDGATLCLWSDRHAYTIVRVSASGKTLWAKRDKATRIDSNGMSEAQEYRYEDDPNSIEQRFSLRKDGTWRMAGGSTRLSIGHRSEHYDYSF